MPLNRKTAHKIDNPSILREKEKGHIKASYFLLGLIVGVFGLEILILLIEILK